MGKWSLHPGDGKSRRLRLRPWDKGGKSEPEPEVEEDFFNPEYASTDNNPFPVELMTEADAVAVAEEVQMGAAVELEDVVEPEPEPEPTYDSMTVTQLQDLLRERGLTVSGVKAELVARLEADDAGPSEESEAPAETVETPLEEAVSSDEMPQEGEVSESGDNE